MLERGYPEVSPHDFYRELFPAGSLQQEPEDRIRAKEAGMNEHVAKPVDVELLMKVIYSGSAMKH